MFLLRKHICSCKGKLPRIDISTNRNSGFSAKIVVKLLMLCHPLQRPESPLICFIISITGFHHEEDFFCINLKFGFVEK